MEGGDIKVEKLGGGGGGGGEEMGVGACVDLIAKWGTVKR